MTQSPTLTLPDSNGATFLSNLNTQQAALFSTNSGATAPSPTVAGMLWADTSLASPVIRARNTANTAWVDVTPTVAVSQNRIINGDFGVWQRATTSAALGYVAADRWKNDFVGGTVTQSQQAFTLGTAINGINPGLHLRQSVSGQTLTTQYAATSQAIEGVRSYAGQTITLLGWAKRASGAGNAVIEAVQNFGTGGSPSASVTGISPTTVTLTTSWAPFAVVLTIPSVTGKTLGTALNDYLQIVLWESAGSTFNARANSLGLQTIAVDWWGLHIKVGTHAVTAITDYYPRDPGTELALCQRYYQAVGSFVGVGGASNAVTQTIALPVTMRGVPTASTSGVITITDGYVSDFTQSAVNISLLSATNRSAYVILGALSGLTVGRLYFSRISNSNSVVFDAEL